MRPHEWTWAIRDAPVDRTAKLVAWALGSRMNGTGECWPSKAQLAADTGLDVRTVDRAVVRLERAGLVTVRRGNGRGHPNRYRPGNPGVNPGASAGVYPEKPRQKRQINPGTVPGEEVPIEENARARAREDARTPAFFGIDEAMLELARGWLKTH